MMIAEMLSMNMPTTISSIMAKIRKAIGDVEMLLSQPPSSAGTFWLAMSQEKILAVAMMIITAAEMPAARRMSGGIAASPTSRETEGETRKPAATAMAVASVGVKR